MSAKTPKVKTPPDPDPAPVQNSNSAPEARDAARNERKRFARSFNRQNTIIAGLGSPQDNGDKKTILG